MRSIVILVAVAAALAAVCAAESPHPRDEAEISTAELDLAGYRVCPRCDTVNPPEASYCMACGAPLGAAGEAAWRRTPATVAPELIVWQGSASAAFVTTYDGGGWSNELTLAAVYDFDDIVGGSLTDRIHFYFSRKRLRPFLSVEPELIIVDGEDPEGRLAVAGGVRYGYGPYGSYVYAGAGVGVYFRHDYYFSSSSTSVRPYSLVHARLLHLFTPHVGIGGSVNGLSLAAITVGPAFAF
jgi:ribosomal protein L40E